MTDDPILTPAQLDDLEASFVPDPHLVGILVRAYRTLAGVPPPIESKLPQTKETN